MPVGRVLVVDDDRAIVRVVRAYLERDGFVVETAFDGLLGLRVALEKCPTLIVLDWMLPDLDGLEFLRRLRVEQNTPVILLTARTEESDRVLGLELGADDYVTKPFSARELTARVRAVHRRLEAGFDVPALLTVGDLVIDRESRTVKRQGGFLDLTMIEFDLLQTLAERPGRVYSRNELLNRVWGSDFEGVDRVVDVHLSHLRQKVEPDPTNPSLLATVRGVGYKLVEASP